MERNKLQVSRMYGERHCELFYYAKNERLDQAWDVVQHHTMPDPGVHSLHKREVCSAACHTGYKLKSYFHL